MTQPYPVLKIEGDFDDDGSEETGIFEMPQTTVSVGQLSEFLAQFGSGGGAVSSLNAQVCGNKGEAVIIDGGAGPRTWEIEFTGGTGSDDYQWGNDSTAGLSALSATGQDRVSQAEVINEWIARIDIGSNNPATLFYGEHSNATGFSEPGVYEPVAVAIRDPQFVVPEEETSTFNGSLTCVSVTDVRGIVDGATRTE